MAAYPHPSLLRGAQSALADMISSSPARPQRGEVAVILSVCGGWGARGRRAARGWRRAFGGQWPKMERRAKASRPSGAAFPAGPGRHGGDPVLCPPQRATWHMASEGPHTSHQTGRHGQRCRFQLALGTAEMPPDSKQSPSRPLVSRWEPKLSA